MFAINTETLDDYIEVLTWAFDQNMRWRDGDVSINESYWYGGESETCVIIDDMVITYSDCEYFSRTYDKVVNTMEHFREETKTYYKDKFRKKFGLR